MGLTPRSVVLRQLAAVDVDESVRGTYEVVITANHSVQAKGSATPEDRIWQTS
jgi:hypothetical protein